MSAPESPDAPESGSRLVRQLSTFAMVGLLATGLYLIVANALMFLTDMDARWASVLAYCAGMVVSFAGQSRLTFGIRKTGRGHFIRFLIVSAIGLLVSYASVVFVTDVLLANPAWATLATAALVPFGSFIAMKLWVFATRN